MSRVGKMPIEVPAGATVVIEPDRVSVKGPKGELSQPIADPARIKVEQVDGRILVTRLMEDQLARSLHGLTRTLIHNMVKGVTEGFEKVLEIEGVGYRAQLKGNTLELQLGFSHPCRFEAPAGIEFEVPVPTRVIVKGCDKQLVGQVAANNRGLRKPDPYKGKGIRYRGEYVRRKVGKAIK